MIVLVVTCSLSLELARRMPVRAALRRALAWFSAAECVVWAAFWAESLWPCIHEFGLVESALVVRAQRSSCANRSGTVVSGTVVAGMVGASATFSPSARTSLPSSASSATWFATASNPPIPSSVARVSAIVAPRQSCRPTTRDKATEGRKSRLIYAAPSRPAAVSLAQCPAQSVVTSPTPGWPSVSTTRRT